jgi:PHD/YefM family antitoxin component YafN of YafNO toxin-antitoxin module
MIKVSPRFVVDEKQHPEAVLLTVEEWDSILDELEELEDIRAYDQAKASDDEQISFDQAVREIEEKYKA